MSRFYNRTGVRVRLLQPKSHAGKTGEIVGTEGNYYRIAFDEEIDGVTDDLWMACGDNIELIGPEDEPEGYDEEDDEEDEEEEEDED